MASNTDSLLVILNTTNLQKNDPRLYQVLKSLIENLLKNEDSTAAIISGTAGGITGGITQLTGDVSAIGPGVAVATIPALQDEFLTASDETATLPNSRELLAGTGITFDDTVANQRTINADVSLDHVVMSNGVQPPTPVDDGFGNFTYIAYTP